MGNIFGNSGANFSLFWMPNYVVVYFFWHLKFEHGKLCAKNLEDTKCSGEGIGGRWKNGLSRVSSSLWVLMLRERNLD